MAPKKEFPFQIQYQNCEGYLYAFISGEQDSLESALKYWQRIINECHERRFHALLVEENFPNQISTAEMFQLTSAISEMGSRGLKIAFVDKNAAHNELNLFGETVAVNRGVSGRVCTSREEAAAWLTV